MKTYRLQIVTPDRPVCDGQVQALIVRTVTGDVCILPGHIDYAVPLGIGNASVTFADGSQRTAACNGGLLSVNGDEVTMLCTTFEWSDEIDLERARAAKQKAEQRMEVLQRDDERFAVAEAKLKRAVARLRVSEK